MEKELELTKMSSKGQVVIPKDIRDESHFKSGETFVVFGKGDTVVLKKVEMPSAKETFEEISSWGRKHARRLGIKQKDVEKIIHEHRGIKHAKSRARY